MNNQQIHNHPYVQYLESRIYELEHRSQDMGLVETINRIVMQKRKRDGAGIFPYLPNSREIAQVVKDLKFPDTQEPSDQYRTVNKGEVMFDGRRFFSKKLMAYSESKVWVARTPHANSVAVFRGSVMICMAHCDESPSVDSTNSGGAS